LSAIIFLFPRQTIAQRDTANITG